MKPQSAFLCQLSSILNNDLNTISKQIVAISSTFLVIACGKRRIKIDSVKLVQQTAISLKQN